MRRNVSPGRMQFRFEPIQLFCTFVVIIHPVNNETNDIDGCAGSLRALCDGPDHGGEESGPDDTRRRPRLPYGGRPLRRAPRRRGPQPRSRRLLEGFRTRGDDCDRRSSSCRSRTGDRDSVRLDRRHGLPARGKSRFGLLALAQRPPGSRGQRPADARGVRPDPSSARAPTTSNC